MEKHDHCGSWIRFHCDSQSYLRFSGKVFYKIFSHLYFGILLKAEKFRRAISRLEEELEIRKSGKALQMEKVGKQDKEIEDLKKSNAAFVDSLNKMEKENEKNKVAMGDSLTKLENENAVLKVIFFKNLLVALCSATLNTCTCSNLIALLRNCSNH